MPNMKKQTGITLIALVITIIVLLILAGIVLQLVLEQNGVIQKAQMAGKEYKNSERNELEDLNNLNNYIIATTRGNIDKNNITIVSGTANGLKNSLVKIADFPEGYNAKNCYILGTKANQIVDGKQRYASSHSMIYPYMDEEGIYLWIGQDDLLTANVEVILMKIE